LRVFQIKNSSILPVSASGEGKKLSTIKNSKKIVIEQGLCEVSGIRGFCSKSRISRVVYPVDYTEPSLDLKFH